MFRGLKIILEKKVEAPDYLWGAAITSLFFLEDGTAWAGNGEYATQIRYNPFDGTKMDVSYADDFSPTPAFLIGKKCNDIYIRDNVLFLKVDGILYMLTPPPGDKVNRLVSPRVHHMKDKVIKDITFMNNKPYYSKTIPQNGGWREDRVVFLCEDNFEVELIWTIESLGYKGFVLTVCED